MMKHLSENPPPSDHSNDASSSGGSEAGQVIGAHTISMNEGDPMGDSSVCWFRRWRYLNSARMIFAEMVGTFIFMFCVCGIIGVTEPIRGGVGLLEYAATGGLSIAVVIFSIGPISGAHINPSVTIAFATIGQFPWSKVPLYISAQMVGSILATYVGNCLYNVQADLMTTKPFGGLKSAFWVELFATLIIMFLAAALSSQVHVVGHLSGFIVGVAIALGVLVTGPVSGASMNPARSFGPAIFSRRFDNIWLYLLAPTVGAMAGALLFRLLSLQRRP